MGGMCPLVGTMAELPYVPGHPQGPGQPSPHWPRSLSVTLLSFLASYSPNLRPRKDFGQ